MEGRPPDESFPQIGTIEDPAYFKDCHRNLLLCYDIAPVDGGGNVVLEFRDVVYFEENPNNAPEGLCHAKYPVRLWDFTEVVGSDRTDRWSTQYFPRRFWTISFNDSMVEVVFSSVRQVHLTREPIDPDAALLEYLCAHR
ncbi:MAG: hypothetical protein JSR86_13005 [Proteobacteria bacterium]|nr:hypothetical protein [Pseudomonadota bacterium]